MARTLLYGKWVTVTHSDPVKDVRGCYKQGYIVQSFPESDIPADGICHDRRFFCLVVPGEQSDWETWVTEMETEIIEEQVRNVYVVASVPDPAPDDWKAWAAEQELELSIIGEAEETEGGVTRRYHAIGVEVPELLAVTNVLVWANINEYSVMGTDSDPVTEEIEDPVRRRNYMLDISSLPQANQDELEADRFTELT